MAIRIEADLSDVEDLLDAIIETFDFTLPGADGSLGRDLAAAAVIGIEQRSNQGLGPDGTPFRANEEKYAARKLARLGVDRPGEVSGQMLSKQSLQGQVTVGPQSIEIRYGTGQAPRSATSRSGAALTKSEAAATDREKAGYFEASGRRFYGFDARGEDEARLAAVAQEALTRHARLALD